MRHRRAAVMAAALAVLAACTSSSGGGPATTATTASPSTIDRNNADGQLTIGVLLPRTGPGAAIGQPMVAAVEMAIREINDAGGVLGRPVRFIEADEGPTTLTAGKALNELIATNVDAIVGPASSKTALSLLDEIGRDQVLTCSPTATAIALSEQRDEGYFIRTIPSDALQAQVLKQEIINQGRRNAAVLYPSDDYGTTFATTLRDALAGARIPTSLHAYDAISQSDMQSVANDVIEAKPDNIVVLGDQAAAPMVAALRKAGVKGQVFVDGGLRHPELANSASAPANTLEGVIGASPSPQPSGADAFVRNFSQFAPDLPVGFAPYAYDCANIIALAAAVAGSDNGLLMRQAVVGVTSFGFPCANYADCSERLGEKRDIDYNGASGAIDLDDNGDPRHGLFDVFTIQGGRDVEMLPERV